MAKSKITRPKPLHLVLKSKWYEKIESGEKTAEYRACKNYWNKRLAGLDTADGQVYMGFQTDFSRRFSSVIFHKGYTNHTMEYIIRSIRVITCQPNDLGLFQCWEIKLGQRITKGGDNE